MVIFIILLIWYNFCFLNFIVENVFNLEGHLLNRYLGLALFTVDSLSKNWLQSQYRMAILIILLIW